MIQQRLGESDKDYEARKKRVRRTRQGVDFGLAHAGGGGGGGGGTTASSIIKYDMNIVGAELPNLGSDAPLYNAPVINATQNGPGSILVDGTTDIDTGFKPNISQYSIEETVTGELANFGNDLVDTANTVAAWDASTTNTVEQEDNAVKITGVSLLYAYVYLNASGGLSENLNTSSTYLVSFKIKTNSGSTIQHKIYDGSGYIQTEYITNTEYVTVSATMSPTSTNVFFRVDQIAVGEIVWVGDISVKEVIAPTQRTEQRLLTHDGSVLGTNIHDNTVAFTFVAGSDTTITYLSDGWNNIAVTSSANFQDNRPIWNIGTLSPNMEIGKTYQITYSVKINSGNVNIGRVFAGSYLQDLVTDNYETNDTISFTKTIVDDYVNFVFAMNSEATDERICNFDMKIDSVIEVSTETKYYINGLEQSSVPALPDPNTNINLNDTAVIGYPDTIQSREADLKVHTTVRTDAEILADHNKWISATYTVLTDGNGDPLTDANGVYLYTT